MLVVLVVLVSAFVLVVLVAELGDAAKMVGGILGIGIGFEDTEEVKVASFGCRGELNSGGSKPGKDEALYSISTVPSGDVVHVVLYNVYFIFSMMGSIGGPLRWEGQGTRSRTY